jgi:hypothetical protein
MYRNKLDVIKVRTALARLRDEFGIGQLENNLVKCGKCGKMWQNVAKCGKMWQNVAKCGKTWQNVGMCAGI